MQKISAGPFKESGAKINLNPTDVRRRRIVKIGGGESVFKARTEFPAKSRGAPSKVIPAKAEIQCF
jgi:hypothetical protein